MKTKRSELNPCYTDFKIKSITKDDSGATVIEGWANRATVDRTDEIIDPNAWNLEDYQKNPVILFNHGKDPNYGFMPIGKALDVKPTPDGLYAKVQISKSDDPKIKIIRDLVSEGILKTFSVGFDPVDEQKDMNTGVNVVTDASLLEISIVTLPMNQDSVFSLSSKGISAMKSKIADKALKAKGAWVASAVQQRIYQLQQSHGDFNRDRALDEIASKTGTRLDDVRQVLAGEVTPVPKDMLAAFSQVLGMDEDQLNKLDKGDVEVEKRQATAGGARQSGGTLKGVSLPPLRPDGPADWAEVMERQPKPQSDVDPYKKSEPGPDAVHEEDEEYADRVRLDAAGPQDHGQGGEGESDAETDPHGQQRNPIEEKDSEPLGTGEPETEPGEEQATSDADDEDPNVAIQAIVIPKDVVENVQDATTWVKDHGWEVDDINQSEDAFYFVQRDPSGFAPESYYLIDIGGGVYAQVGVEADREPSGTPPIDAQQEAKGSESPHNSEEEMAGQVQEEPPVRQIPPEYKAEEDAHDDHLHAPKKQPAAKPASAPNLSKDGAGPAGGGGGVGGGNVSTPGSSGGSTPTQPFATPQGPGPWTSHKKPPKKKPTVNIDPHTGKPKKLGMKMEDPNASNAADNVVDSEALDEKLEKMKAAGHACADCMSKWMKDGLDNGKPHDQAVAIAISECKAVCPTEPQKDATGAPDDSQPAYSGDQIRAFTDGYRSAYEQFKGQRIHSGKSHESGRTKQGHMDQSPTTTISGGGSQDPTIGMDDNPYMLAAKQTNVLLSSIVAALQDISQKFEDFLQQESNEPEHQQGIVAKPKPVAMPPKGDPHAKALENLSDYMRDLNVRVKALDGQLTQYEDQDENMQ